MKASLKINQIEAKISELQSKKQHLLEERQKEITALIATLGLTSLDDKTLIGGLQFLKHKCTTHDPILEEWHIAGGRFLQHTKRFKRINISKRDSSSLLSHQSSQKAAQSREKKNENPKTI